MKAEAMGDRSFAKDLCFRINDEKPALVFADASAIQGYRGIESRLRVNSELCAGRLTITDHLNG